MFSGWRATFGPDQSLGGTALPEALPVADDVDPMSLEVPLRTPADQATVLIPDDPQAAHAGHVWHEDDADAFDGVAADILFEQVFLLSDSNLDDLPAALASSGSAVFDGARALTDPLSPGLDDDGWDMAEEDAPEFGPFRLDDPDAGMDLPAGLAAGPADWLDGDDPGFFHDLVAALLDALARWTAEGYGPLTMPEALLLPPHVTGADGQADALPGEKGDEHRAPDQAGSQGADMAVDWPEGVMTDAVAQPSPFELWAAAFALAAVAGAADDRPDGGGGDDPGPQDPGADPLLAAAEADGFVFAPALLRAGRGMTADLVGGGGAGLPGDANASGLFPHPPGDPVATPGRDAPLPDRWITPDAGPGGHLPGPAALAATALAAPGPASGADAFAFL